MTPENILSKFAHNSTLEGVVDACAAIQKDLNNVEKCTKRNLRKGKCKVLRWGGTTSCTSTDWSWPARKEFCRKVSCGGQAVLEPVISPCCKESQTYPLPYVTRTREAIVPLYSALLRPLSPVLSPVPGCPRQGHRVKMTDRLFSVDKRWRAQIEIQEIPSENTSENFLILRVVRHWTGCPEVEILKTKLEMALSNLLYFTLLWAGYWD